MTTRQPKYGEDRAKIHHTEVLIIGRYFVPYGIGRRYYPEVSASRPEVWVRVLGVNCYCGVIDSLGLINHHIHGKFVLVPMAGRAAHGFAQFPVRQ